MTTTKKCLLAIVLSFTLVSAKAQFVILTDTNFISWLNNNGFSACLNGYYLDTTCNAVVNTTAINCNASGIKNIDGIVYFDNLDSLDCGYNQIQTLPLLPPGLKSLKTVNTGLTFITPPLPASLTNLNVSHNYLGPLPALPPTLQELDCSRNQMNALPALPASLTSLNCYFNYMNSLPALPAALTFLRCSKNNFTTLPALPVSLVDLDCSDNSIDSLPVLPSSLQYLDCGKNELISLPALSLALKILRCNDNQLTALPALPSSLTNLLCSQNQLTLLPSFPPALDTISIFHNQVTSLPALPASLLSLACDFNQLSSLPALPASLKFLNCGFNSITALPVLPSSLEWLGCHENQITSLPALPSSLLNFGCGSNQLTSIPTLPPALKNFTCYQNLLTSLPALPNTLTGMNCSYNQLTSLPPLSPLFTDLLCSFNQLTSLPPLPSTMSYLDIERNYNLTCLPAAVSKLKYFYWDSTAITCFPGTITMLPNGSFIPPVTNVPVCDLLNPANCAVNWNITGKIFTDVNADCIFDSSEIVHGNVKMNLYKAGTLISQTFSNGLGQYTFDTDSGTYTYIIDTLAFPLNITCPGSFPYTSTVTPGNLYHSGKDFSVQCNPGFDIGVSTVAASGIFRPANYTTVNIHAGDMSKQYNWNCAAGIAGTVTVNINGPGQFSSVTPGALTPIINGNTLTYTITDFGATDFYHDFSIVVQTDTTAPINSYVCFDVNVTPASGDNNPVNNQYTFCYRVMNSFDPNDKQVYPDGSTDTSQHWLTYTIRFQNTGNAPAQHIYIMDTLDNAIDESSIQLLAYSHEPLVQVTGNIARFNFPNINLPDSVNNEPGSHGYVQYKVRLQENLPVGTQVHNTAYIYFDFNQPVQTNTTFNQLTSVVGIASVNKSPTFTLYPNPVGGGRMLNLYFNSIAKQAIFSLYDMSGRKVYATILSSGTQQQLALPLLAKGIYQGVMDDGIIILHEKLVVN